MQKIPVYGKDRKDRNQDIPASIIALTKALTYYTQLVTQPGFSNEDIKNCSENIESFNEQLDVLGWSTVLCEDDNEWYACPKGYTIEHNPDSLFYPMYRRYSIDQGPQTWQYFYKEYDPQPKWGFRVWENAYNHLFRAYQEHLKELPCYRYSVSDGVSTEPVSIHVTGVSPEHAKEHYLSHCVQVGFITTYQAANRRVYLFEEREL